jgi:uncharacterized protein YndB with AHSA1/START domain
MSLEITEKKYTEPEFATQVEHLLKMFGWHWCHFRPARTEHGWRTAISGHKGFPDYIAVRPPRLLVFELKSERGKVSPEQQEWLDILGQLKDDPYGESTVEVYLFRPSDIEEIAEVLK